MGRERQDGGLMELYTQAAREAASPEAMGARLHVGPETGDRHFPQGSVEMARSRV